MDAELKKPEWGGMRGSQTPAQFWKAVLQNRSPRVLAHSPTLLEKCPQSVSVEHFFSGIDEGR